MRAFGRVPLLAGVACAAMVGAAPAWANEESDEDDDRSRPTIVVSAALENPLVEEAATGSRLGLTPLETPASVYSVDGDSIRALGDTDFNEAVTRAPGLAQSQSPGNGSIDGTSRGVGGGSGLQPFDGLRLSPTNGSPRFP